jgi:hypothetical protein
MRVCEPYSNILKKNKKATVERLMSEYYDKYSDFLNWTKGIVSWPYQQLSFVNKDSPLTLVCQKCKQLSAE